MATNSLENIVPDPYEILGLDPDCTERQITEAYRKGALKWHPDKNPNEKEKAEKKFKEVQQAYELLMDPATRKEHDERAAAERRRTGMFGYGLAGYGLGYGLASTFSSHAFEFDPFNGPWSHLFRNPDTGLFGSGGGPSTSYQAEQNFSRDFDAEENIESAPSTLSRATSPTSIQAQEETTEAVKSHIWAYFDKRLRTAEDRRRLHKSRKWLRKYTKTFCTCKFCGNVFAFEKYRYDPLWDHLGSEHNDNLMPDDKEKPFRIHYVL